MKEVFEPLEERTKRRGSTHLERVRVKEMEFCDPTGPGSGEGIHSSSSKDLTQWKVGDWKDFKDRSRTWGTVLWSKYGI